MLKYDTVDNLLGAMESAVIKPALERAVYLRVRKAQPIRERHVSQYPRGYEYSDEERRQP